MVRKGEESKDMIPEYTNDQLTAILQEYGISEINEYKMVDSSHGEDDVRHNYIIDRRYVLRVNSALVMTEQRLEELNPLIARYNVFGIRAPHFIRGTDGHFLRERDGNYIYLSEYLDLPTADDLYDNHPERKEDLITQRLIMVARFAEAFHGQGLIDTWSMFSMFELAPYDIPYGIDEKQQNVNLLTADLREQGETALADRIIAENERIRSKLLPIYRELPQCVFQGDENFSNVCIDESGKIIGLFDFNMSGRDVNANYLANVAYLARFVLDDDIFDTHDAALAFDAILDGFCRSTKIIRQHYHFTEPEWEAYLLYAKIVMFSGWANASTFRDFLKKPEYRAQCLKLIGMILDWDADRAWRKDTE